MSLVLHATFSFLYMSLYVHTIADREKFKVAKYVYISDFPIKYFLLSYVADYHLFLSNMIFFRKIMIIFIPFNCFLSVTICIYIYIYIRTWTQWRHIVANRRSQMFDRSRSVNISNR